MNGRSGMLTSHRLHEAVRHVPQYATQQRYSSSLGLSKLKKPDYKGAASDTQHLNNTWGALSRSNVQPPTSTLTANSSGFDSPASTRPHRKRARAQKRGAAKRNTRRSARGDASETRDQCMMIDGTKTKSRKATQGQDHAALALAARARSPSFLLLLPHILHTNDSIIQSYLCMCDVRRQLLHM